MNNFYVNNVRNLANTVMKNNQHVKINKIKPINGFETIKNKVHIQKSLKKTIECMIYTCSINYCFWFGSYDIRPNYSSSNKLIEIIRMSFFNCGKLHPFYSYNETLKKSIRSNRFPLIEERCNHIDEIFNWIKIQNDHSNKMDDPEKVFSKLVQETSCFSSDLFLKRAQLIFIILSRVYDLFNDFANELTVPADYQIPKVLNQLGLISYSRSLSKKIKNNELIQKGSKEEVEIRAATILVCDELAKIHETSPSEIDGYLFYRLKNTFDVPFHLTITTDY